MICALPPPLHLRRRPPKKLSKNNILWNEAAGDRRRRRRRRRRRLKRGRRRRQIFEFILRCRRPAKVKYRARLVACCCCYDFPRLLNMRVPDSDCCCSSSSTLQQYHNGFHRCRYVVLCFSLFPLLLHLLAVLFLSVSGQILCRLLNVDCYNPGPTFERL